MTLRKRLGIVALVAVVGGIAATYIGGSILVAPHPSVLRLPADLARAEAVAFASGSGSRVHGWFLAGASGNGAVLLLHGVEASRMSMVDRARMLARDGYAVLLIDFQAAGESPGRHTTFGYLESRDAQAAVAYLRSREPEEKIGVIGTSMGGAAAVLADPPLDVDALVLEEVYPTIVEALDNRLAMRLGRLGPLLAPVLTLQLRPRLGIGTEDLRPVAAVSRLRAPKLFVAGSADRHTTLAQSRALFEAASEPKELWIVEGARHVDMYAFAGERYAERVSAFLGRWLRDVPPRALLGTGLGIQGVPESAVWETSPQEGRKRCDRGGEWPLRSRG